MERTNYSSGTRWEEVVGYSRAVKAGNVVEVTGTVAVDDSGNLVGAGDAYAQTKFILEKIAAVLQRAGSNMSQVVRTRLFVTDISCWEEYGRAHGEVFREIKPCTTMVEVSKLISPEYLIEIEATAIIL